MDAFGRALGEVFSRAQEKIVTLEYEMWHRARTVRSISHAREILAETNTRMAAIIAAASTEVDQIALDEKRKGWS